MLSGCGSLSLTGVPLPGGADVGSQPYAIVVQLQNVQDLVPQYAIDLGILKNRSLIRLLKEIERTVYRNVQLITVHSRGNAEYMAREGVASQKVAVVPNWVDTRLIRPASRETAYRQKAGLQGKFVVLFAGMLGFAQDVDTPLMTTIVPWAPWLWATNFTSTNLDPGHVTLYTYDQNAGIISYVNTAVSNGLAPKNVA